MANNDHPKLEPAE